MLHMELATIAVCLWSIHLHRRLKRRDADVCALMDAIGNIADGNVTVKRNNGKLIVQHNRGVK